MLRVASVVTACFFLHATIEHGIDRRTSIVSFITSPSCLCFIALPVRAFDESASYLGLPNILAGIAVVVTDGGSGTFDSLKAAGDALRAEGLTVVGVGIGSGANINNLEALASTDEDGDPLVFSGEMFDQIESLLMDAIHDIGTLPEVTIDLSLTTRGLKWAIKS